MYINGSLGITAKKNTIFRDAPSKKFDIQRLKGYIPILNKNIARISINTKYK